MHDQYSLHLVSWKIWDTRQKPMWLQETSFTVWKMDAPMACLDPGRLLYATTGVSISHHRSDPLLPSCILWGHFIKSTCSTQGIVEAVIQNPRYIPAPDDKRKLLLALEVTPQKPLIRPMEVMAHGTKCPATAEDWVSNIGFVMVHGHNQWRPYCTLHRYWISTDKIPKFFMQC